MTNPATSISRERRLLIFAAVLLTIAFPAMAPAADTTPPRPPNSLSATVNAGQIALKWTAARDNVGVKSYLVQRCQGGGCKSFATIAQTAATTFTDSGLPTGISFSYRVAGVDATGNVGRYSAVATATAKGAGSPPPSSETTLAPKQVALLPSMTQQFSTTLHRASWSVDGIQGGNATVGRITANGVYSAPRQAGEHTVTARMGNRSASGKVHVTDNPGVFTHHNDNLRTGQNLSETVLTPKNVNTDSFGKLFSYHLDGIVYAAPVYVANVPIGRNLRNVVYAATEHNTVYALDADRVAAPLWRRSFINPAAGVTTVSPQDVGECCDIAPEIGITGTPVIDQASRTLYVVAKTKETSAAGVRYVHRLHALDLSTGAEKFGGPVEIDASVPGFGQGSEGGQIQFNSLRQNQRPALLLSRGVVYVAFGSHGDEPPYHGWIIGYDADTLDRVMVFNVSPSGYGGGFWQGGGGPAADAQGNLFIVSGNGTFDVNTGGNSYGDSFLKLSATGRVLDFFTPHDQATLDPFDIDLGSGGLVLIPQRPGATPLMTAAGKAGTLYLVNRNNLGHYNPNNDNQVLQSLVDIFRSNFSAPVYFDDTVYFSASSSSIAAFSVVGSALSVGPVSLSAESYRFPGGGLAISAEGATNAILWAVQRNGDDPAILRAYNARNLAQTLYSSDAAGSRDAMDAGAKFAVPVVANGKVFVGSMSRLTVFGLLP